MKDMQAAFLPGLLAGIFLCLVGCQGSGAPNLRYEITKSWVDSLPALEVQVHFSADTGRVTYVQYADEAWGQKDLFNSLREVRLLEGKGTLQVQRDSGRIRIEHAPDAGELTLRYKVVQDTPGPKGARENYRPIVQPAYFHIFSHNLFAVPGHYLQGEEPKAQVALEWKGWEPDEVIHHSFGSQQRQQDLGVVPLEKFQSAIFVGGDFRIYQQEIEGNELLLAVRGDLIPFRDAGVMELLSETVRAQRDFWKDHSQPYFTVTLRPYPQEKGSSFQGTGLTNSFATSISNNGETELEQLAYLFNHELMHNWIGYTIKNADEEAQYWFSEGFTEYYTSKNMAVYGIDGKDWGYFIRNFNQTLEALMQSPIGSAPNSEINYDNFWKDPEYGKLPYRRGMLFACYLDLQLQAVSGGEYSLDDVMRDLLAASRDRGQKLTHAHFLETANAYLSEDLTPFFERHIINGEPLPFDTLFRQLGFDFGQEEPVLDLGFRFDDGQTRIVEVDPDSEAFRAGVRQGDRVVSQNNYMGRTKRGVEMVLERDGRRFPISYLPVLQEPVVQLLDTPANRVRLRR